MATYTHQLPQDRRVQERPVIQSRRPITHRHSQFRRPNKRVHLSGNHTAAPAIPKSPSKSSSGLVELAMLSASSWAAAAT
jgi:hypothetical protein